MMKHNRSKEIAELVCRYWHSVAVCPYFLLASDHTIKLYAEMLQIEGFKKRFFQSKRDFVVGTILGDNAMFLRVGLGVIYLCLGTSGKGKCWDGFGRISTSLHDRVAVGFLPPDLGIQIDISPIYEQLKPFLLTA